MSTSNGATARARVRHLYLVPSSSPAEEPETTPDFSEPEARAPQRGHYDMFMSHRFIAAMASAMYDQAVRHAERLASDPVDYMLSVMQWQYGVAADMLLDPEKAVIAGDGPPDGALREPAWLYTQAYDALRATQAQLAEMRRMASRSGRDGAQSVAAAHPGMLSPEWLKSPWGAWLDLWRTPSSDSYT